MRNANGTGPYQLERYEPDVRTVLKRNPRWWGWSDKRIGQRRRGRLAGDPRRTRRRLAALISGEVDMVLDPPIPDVARLKREARSTAAAGRRPRRAVPRLRPVARDELEDSDVKSAGNPFKDICACAARSTTRSTST